MLARYLFLVLPHNLMTAGVLTWKAGFFLLAVRASLLNWKLGHLCSLCILRAGTSNVNKLLTQPGWQEAAHGTGTPDIWHFATIGGWCKFFFFFFYWGAGSLVLLFYIEQVLNGAVCAMCLVTVLFWFLPVQSSAQSQLWPTGNDRAYWLHYCPEAVMEPMGLKQFHYGRMYEVKAVVEHLCYLLSAQSLASNSKRSPFEQAMLLKTRNVEKTQLLGIGIHCKKMPIQPKKHTARWACCSSCHLCLAVSGHCQISFASHLLMCPAVTGSS